jgi:energy-coupling factor transporter ATP-binding protein EcfA2
MQIISLQAENIKRLTAVEIRPDGALVQITGRNGAGKTSVLDAIWWALVNARHIQSQPIRAGASKARIRLDLGELVVTRRFTRQEDETFTTTITVENAQGARFSSPQKMLDELIGALTFDPLQFTRLDPKEQLQTLKALVPGVDFAAIETANQKDFAKRTDLNRTAGDLKARARSIEVPAGTPAEPIDETALVNKLATVAEHNAAIEREKARRERIEMDIAALASGIENDNRSLEQHRLAIQRLDASISEKSREWGLQKNELERYRPLADKVDPSEVQGQIEGARATNAAVNAAKTKADLERQALEVEVAAGHLTRAMRDRAAKIAEADAAANLPVPGLAFGEGQVFLTGLPFSQASDAEQLRASMAIAMAMSPKLQVIRVRDGSLLDEDGLRIVADMAEKHGFQVWIERVDSSGKVGFVIEDGALKGAAVREAAE